MLFKHNVSVQAVPLNVEVFSRLQASGTLPFDLSAGSGLDNLVADTIVRSGDIVTYDWEWAVNETLLENNEGSDSFELIGVLSSSNSQYPQAGTWLDIPAGCDIAASSISSDGLTLHCVLGTKSSGTTGSIFPQARAGIAANGTTITHQLSMVGNESGTIMDTSAAGVVISAAPLYNLNITGTPVGGEWGDPTPVVPGDNRGYTVLVPVTIDSGGESGFGTEPLDGNPITFTIDLQSGGMGTYPNMSLADAAVGMFDSCGSNGASSLEFANIPSIPFSGVGVVPNATEANSTESSSVWSCSQSGDIITVSISGYNPTPSNFPTEYANGTLVPSIRKVFLSGYVALFVPYTDMFAVAGSTPFTASIPLQFGVTASGVQTFDPLGVSGGSNFGSGFEPLSDNTNTTSYSAIPAGYWSTNFSNTPWLRDTALSALNVTYANGSPGPNQHYALIPSQSQSKWAGNGLVVPGQEFVLDIRSRYNNVVDDPGFPINPYGTQLGTCSKIDYRHLEVSPYTDTTIVSGSSASPTFLNGTSIYEAYPSGGQKAAWALGSNVSSNDTFPLIYGLDYVVEYGSYASGWADPNSDSGVAQSMTSCDDISADAWVQDPTSDPVNFPLGWGSVKLIRSRLLRVPPQADDSFRFELKVNLSVKATCIEGEYLSIHGIPNSINDFDFTDGVVWGFDQSYDPLTHSVLAMGDRAQCTSAIPSIAKQEVPTTSQSSTYGLGDYVTFDIDYTLTGGEGSTTTHPSTVIVDVLPAGLTYYASSIPLSSGPVAGPTTGPIASMPAVVAGESLLTWDIPNVGENTTGMITVTAIVDQNAPIGTRIKNVSYIDVPDISMQPPLGKRASSATVYTKYTWFNEMKVTKSTEVLPYIDNYGNGYVDPNGSVTYTISVENNSGHPLHYLDIVDVIPVNQDNAYNDDVSVIHNSVSLTGITISGFAASDIVCWYTSDSFPAVEPAPYDPLVYNLSWAIGSCSAPPADTTAVWFEQQGNFMPDDFTTPNVDEGALYEITVTITGDSNYVRDLYSNEVAVVSHGGVPLNEWIGMVDSPTVSYWNNSTRFTVYSDANAPVNGVDLEVDKTLLTTTPLHQGDTAVFSVTVCNANADVDATGVIVQDTSFTETGESTSANSFVSATDPSFDTANGIWNVGVVEADTCKMVEVSVLVTQLGSFINFAEVVSSDLPEAEDAIVASIPANANPIDPSTFEDDADVVPFVVTEYIPVPSIAISKDVCLYSSKDDCLLENQDIWNEQVISPKGSSVIWRISVTNTGEVDLTDVMIEDPNEPMCSQIIPLLVIGASYTFTCETVNVLAGFTNTACASIEDSTVCDDATVKVSALNFVKTSRQKSVSIHDDIEFIFTITNTGEVNLKDVYVDDIDFPECSSSIGFLPVGETVEYSCTITVTTTGNIRNKAQAIGTPDGEGSGVAAEAGFFSTGNPASVSEVVVLSAGQLPLTGFSLIAFLSFSVLCLCIGLYFVALRKRPSN